MGDAEQEQTTLETTQARHRKEQRDLQSRITSKKKNATKKTRKGVNDECAELERQLRERQEREIAAFLNKEAVEEEEGKYDDDDDADADADADVNAVTARLGDASLKDSVSGTIPTATTQQQQQQQQQTGGEGGGGGGGGGGEGGKKRNRQKERLARRAAEVEAAAEAAEQEAANMTDHRAIEKTHFERAFAAHGLVEREIRPDGHCLFAAVADQLAERGIPLLLSSSSTTTLSSAAAAADAGLEEGGRDNTQQQQQQQTQIQIQTQPYKVVRRRATDYMEAHPDDFAPFLEEPLGVYVPKIRDTAEWGGQLELAALANAYGVEIRVVQGDGRVEIVEPTTSSSSSSSGGGGGEGERQKIWLAYYRHGYGLGEHYNSLRKKAS